ncbi:MAG TPA: hypothetical protein VGL99_28165, partial [Chloroflexota bacterium]
EYVGLVAELADWPRRSTLSRRVPTDQEVDRLNHSAGRWRAVTLLDDEPAITTAAILFRRTFVLDPLYDTGDLLYAAWHDPTVNPEHARRLADEAAMLVRASPLLRDGSAVLAPDHLPGSWDPRPGWRRPRADADEPAHNAWALRTALVMLHWADRLDAVVCITRADVVRAFATVLGRDWQTWRVQCGLPVDAHAAHAERLQRAPKMRPLWATARRLMRRRTVGQLGDAACVLEELGADGGAPREWRLGLGPPSLPDPALLLKRVLNATDPHRHPPLPKTRLHRKPLCLLAALDHPPE